MWPFGRRITECGLTRREWFSACTAERLTRGVLMSVRAQEPPGRLVPCRRRRQLERRCGVSRGALLIHSGRCSRRTSPGQRAERATSHGDSLCVQPRSRVHSPPSHRAHTGSMHSARLAAPGRKEVSPTLCQREKSVATHERLCGDTRQGLPTKVLFRRRKLR
jgi:hypothetical protein